jgi:hypothetical protein
MTISVTDSEELRQLTAKYAHYLDQHRIDELVLLFTEDAIWDGRPAGLARREGHDALREGFGGGAGRGFVHLTGNHMVTAFDGESAQGSEYVMAVSTGSQTEMMFVMSRFEDEYARTPDGWRFRKRTLVNLGRVRLAATSPPG